MAAPALKIEPEFPGPRAPSRDDAVLWAQHLKGRLQAARMILVCGERDAADAVAEQLEGHVSVLRPSGDERAIGFVDREAGRDVDDAIGAVFVACDAAMARPAAADLARNLRAVMDRSFHDAPIFVGVTDDGAALTLSESELTPRA